MVVKDLLRVRVPPLMIVVRLLTLWHSKLGHSVDFWIGDKVIHVVLFFVGTNTREHFTLKHSRIRTGIFWSCSLANALSRMPCGKCLDNTAITLRKVSEHGMNYSW